MTAATPTIAIRDDDDLLALYVPRGTVAMDNYVVAPADRVTAVETLRPSAERQHAERTWTAPMVRLHLPGRAFSVWAFYDSAGSFVGWYGNLEAAYVRTDIGIDTQDHCLDVVADVEGRWRWKDEAEFARRLDLGLDTPEHQAAVRQAGEEFVARLTSCQSPFGQGWPQWRAPLEWSPRRLPATWMDHYPTAGRT